MIKTEKNILIAFFLNLTFSIFEMIGGFFTNSIAIISDAVHDFGDALSIGISYFLERKSKKKPNSKYTYGYQRYSVLGALVTTLILAGGECIVIYNSIVRFFNPLDINYNGMIVFAIVGVTVNFLAANVTKEGDSLNQKSVNLHMLEDVFGWIVVLIGSILMKFTNIAVIDNIMSILVALFILYHAIENFKEIIDLFLVKVPKNINVDSVKKYLEKFDDIVEVHHIHVWSLNGEDAYATMHVKTDNSDSNMIKHMVREKLAKYGITHVTIEIENKKDNCDEVNCN